MYKIDIAWCHEHLMLERALDLFSSDAQTRGTHSNNMLLRGIVARRFEYLTVVGGVRRWNRVLEHITHVKSMLKERTTTLTNIVQLEVEVVVLGEFTQRWWITVRSKTQRRLTFL